MNPTLTCRRSTCAGEASRKPTAGLPGASIGLGSRGVDVVRIEADLIVNLALLGIAEHFVGLRDRLELFFRRLIARINVGMVFTGKFAEGLTNVVAGSRLLHAENFVKIFFGCGCHSLVCTENPHFWQSRPEVGHPFFLLQFTILRRFLSSTKTGVPSE